MSSSTKNKPTESEVSMRTRNAGDSANNSQQNLHPSPPATGGTATPLQYSSPATPITSGNYQQQQRNTMQQQQQSSSHQTSNRGTPSPNMNNNSNNRGVINNNNQQHQAHHHHQDDDVSQDEDEEFTKEFLEVAKKHDISVKKLLRSAKQSFHHRQVSSSNVDQMAVAAATASNNNNNASTSVPSVGYGTGSPSPYPAAATSTSVSPTEKHPQHETFPGSITNKNHQQQQSTHLGALQQRPSGLSENSSENPVSSSASTAQPTSASQQQKSSGGQNINNKPLPKARVIDVDLSDLIHRVEKDQSGYDDDDFDYEDAERYYNYNYNQQQNKDSPQLADSHYNNDSTSAYAPYLDGDVLNRNNDNNDMGGPVLSGMSAGAVSSVATSKYNKESRDAEGEALLGNHHGHDHSRRDKKKKRGVKFQTGEELEKVVFYEVDNSIYLRIEYRRPIFGWLCLLVASLAQSAQLTVESYFHNEHVSPYASATWTSMGQIVLISLLCAAYLGACYTGQGILGLGLFRYSVMMQVAVAGVMYSLVGVARQAVTQFSHTSRQLTATAAHPFLIAIFGLVFRNTVFYEEIAGILVFIGGVALALMPKDIELHLWGFAEVVALSNAIYTASMLFTLVKARASSVPTPILAFCCSLIAFIIQCAVAPAATSPYGDDLHYSFTGFSDKTEYWIGFFLATLFSTSALLAFIKALQYLPPITVSVAIAISPILSTFELPILNNNPASLSVSKIFDVYFCVGATLSVCAAIYVLYISSIKRQRVDMLMRSLSRRRKPRDPYNRPGSQQNLQQQQQNQYYNQGDPNAEDNDSMNGNDNNNNNNSNNTGSQPIPIPASSNSTVSMQHLADSYGVGSHPYQQNQYQRNLSPGGSLPNVNNSSGATGGAGNSGAAPALGKRQSGALTPQQPEPRRRDYVVLNNGNRSRNNSNISNDPQEQEISGEASSSSHQQQHMLTNSDNNHNNQGTYGDEEDEDEYEHAQQHLPRFSPHSASSMTKSPGLGGSSLGGNRRSGLFPQSPVAAVNTLHPTSANNTSTSLQSNSMNNNFGGNSAGAGHQQQQQQHLQQAEKVRTSILSTASSQGSQDSSNNNNNRQNRKRSSLGNNNNNSTIESHLQQQHSSSLSSGAGIGNSVPTAKGPTVSNLSGSSGQSQSNQPTPGSVGVTPGGISSSSNLHHQQFGSNNNNGSIGSNPNFNTSNSINGSFASNTTPGSVPSGGGGGGGSHVHRHQIGTGRRRSGTGRRSGGGGGSARMDD